MKNILIIALFSSIYGCAALMGTSTDKMEDCVTRHLKALGRISDTKLNEVLYDRVVDSCKEIHTGRP